VSAALCQAARIALAGDEASVEPWAAGAPPLAIPDVAMEPLVPLAFYRGRGVHSVAVARGLVVAWHAPHHATARELETLDALAGALASPPHPAIEAAGIGTWEWEVASNRLTWDARCRAILGVDGNPPPSYASFVAQVHPDDRARVMERMRAALDPGGDGALHVDHRTASGRWVEERGRAYRKGGQVVRFIGAVVDVTEARHAAEALKGSEAQLRTIADALPQLVLALDPSGRPEYCNREWREHTGLDETGSAAEGWRRVVHAEDGDGLISRWRRALASGEPLEAEARFRRARDGEYRWLLVRALPVRDAEGRTAGWLLTATDIHAQKQAERAMAAAVQVRDDFLSIAGHELKTPLTALHLALQGVARLVGEREEEKLVRAGERLQRSVASCERLMGLVDQLLDVSRMHSGRLTLDLREVNLVEVAREALGRIEEQARLAGCELRLAAGGDVRGMWDRLRMEQIFANLLGNAIKYGGGKPVEVTVGLSGDQALLEVKDHGIGIDVLHQARIFERFERVERDARFSGFGLGLWIVHRIVEALGGKIGVRSAPGLGATFEVRLPRGPLR
jgi:PAS domain S-box-containing protein